VIAIIIQKSNREKQSENELHITLARMVYSAA
jgi:hypothetical protein